jgi:hypothetical protein
MVFSAPRTSDPLVALKAIIDQNPGAGSEKLLALFEAVVYDDNSLRKAVIAQAFSAALLSLSNQSPTSAKERAVWPPGARPQ